MAIIKSDSCRICLQEGLKNIFEEQSNIPICKKIIYCASVQVSLDDLLPKLICDQCLFYLDIAYAFKKECESTDTKLRNLVCKQQSNGDDQEFINVVEYGEGEKCCACEHIQNKAVIVQFSDGSETKSNTPQLVSLKHGKVGRHIAKKNTGKLPQKLHQINNGVMNDQLEPLKNENSNKSEGESAVEFEENSENNVLSVFGEETVVTTDYFPNEDQKNNAQIRRSSEKKKRTRNKIKLKLKMTLRKGTRKVNVFTDHLKIVKQKQKIKGSKITEKGTITKKLEKTKDGFQCDVCNKSFPFRSHLKRHLNKHTGVKLYSCELCDQKFVNNYNLSVHMSKHTGVFPLKCAICGRGLPNPSLLKRHMISHTGERQFQCRYCSATFRQSSSLRSHEKMHLNRPSYHCDICYKVFSYKNSLAAHKMLHFGRQRLSCDVCLSTFSRKSSLVRHMGEHSKTKKIKCKFCDLSFHTRSAYNGHLKTHCKYKCLLCGEGFKYKSNFNEHVKSHKG